MAEPTQEQILLVIDTTNKAIDATSSGSVYWNTIGAISSLRSASGGTRSGTTLRR